MKTFLIFLLIITMVPSARTKTQEQRQLSEIMDSVDTAQNKKKINPWVADILTHCNSVNFCQAGKVLSEIKAEELGLQEHQWMLPRRIASFTECKLHAWNAPPAKSEILKQVRLAQLLKEIRRCAQKQFVSRA